MKKLLVPFTINATSITVDIGTETDWVAFNEDGFMQEFIGRRPAWSNIIGMWIEQDDNLSYTSAFPVIDLDGANWRDMCFPVSARARQEQAEELQSETDALRISLDNVNLALKEAGIEADTAQAGVRMLIARLEQK